MADATTAPSLRAPAGGVDGARRPIRTSFGLADITDAPRSLGAVFSRVGPGLVLAASIVGSGELIATTTLGAQVGYAALWVILVSCIVKPVIQAEMGRYTIATGETALEAMNHVPGPRFGVGWVVWAWAITVALTMAQVGGMLGGVSQVMHLLVPARSGARLGGRVPGDHAGAAARRRLRPRRAVRDGQGRAVHRSSRSWLRSCCCACRSTLPGATSGRA